MKKIKKNQIANVFLNDHQHFLHNRAVINFHKIDKNEKA